MNGRKQDSVLWQVILIVAAMVLCFSVLSAKADVEISEQTQMMEIVKIEGLSADMVFRAGR